MSILYNGGMDANNLTRLFIHATDLALPIISGLGLGYEDTSMPSQLKMKTHL